MTVACLWAAIFNKLLLPWSSKDWSVEQLSSALVATAGVCNRSSQLQFKAATAVSVAGAAELHVSMLGTPRVPAVTTPLQLAAALSAEELALQKTVVEPVVAVQTGRCMLVETGRRWNCSVICYKEPKVVQSQHVATAAICRTVFASSLVLLNLTAQGINFALYCCCC